MTESLSALLVGSWNFLTQKWKPILIGAALFAALMGAAQLLLVEAAVNSKLGDSMDDTERMEELADRMEAGDPTAFQEMMEEIGMVGEDGEVNEDAMEDVATNMMKDMLPTVGAVAIVFMFISLLAGAYYMVLAIDPKLDFQGGLKQVPKVIVPLVGLWIWMFLRSFAWIPFIGIIFAIVIGPRLALAPVILLREKKGIMESTKSSYIRSNGYWGKIIGNAIVAGLCVWLAMMVIGMLTSFLSDISLALGLFAVSLMQMVGSAYLTVFIVKLSDTVLAHPIKAAK